MPPSTHVSGRGHAGSAGVRGTSHLQAEQLHRAGCAQPGGGVQHRGASWLPNKSLKACNIFFNSLRAYNILNMKALVAPHGFNSSLAHSCRQYVLENCRGYYYWLGYDYNKERIWKKSNLFIWFSQQWESLFLSNKVVLDNSPQDVPGPILSKFS